MKQYWSVIGLLFNLKWTFNSSLKKHRTAFKKAYSIGEFNKKQFVMVINVQYIEFVYFNLNFNVCKIR